jgi:Cytochrome c
MGWGLSAMFALADGCGDDGGSSDDNTATQADAGSSNSKTDASTSKADASTTKADPAAIARGKALADGATPVCTSCHTTSYAGAGYYPNITPDKETGIGDWTDKQIGDAITKGIDDEGEALCALMTRYKFSASELADVVAFLRSLPAKSNDIKLECPDT